MKKFSRITFLFHLLAWISFILAPVVFSPGSLLNEITTKSLQSLVVRSITLAALFYFNLYYLTPVLLKKYGWAFFLPTLAFLVLAVSLFNAGFHEYFVEGRGMEMRPPPIPDDMRRFGPRGGPPPMMFASPTFSSFLITIIVATTSSLLVWREEWAKEQAEKQEQIHQKLAAELTALKLQISPHFLFNTLNNIRWLVRSKSDNAEDAVVKLSHLLRYILYQAQADQVDLEKEINHLKDFIELQQMRIEKSDSFYLSIEGDLKNKLIVPLLLLPLTENFFKHGDFTSQFKNKISISVVESFLKMKTENQITLNNEDEHGIGLSNVKRRLTLHYPGRHVLKYFEKDSVFYLELELILNSN